MSIEKSHLIELYKTTLEEARHHDTINMQIFMALGIVFSLFLVAISFIFSRDFPLRQECVYWFSVRAGILVLFGAAEGFFGFVFYRYKKYFEACAKVSKEIEGSLTVDKRTRGTSEFDGLLIGPKLREIDDKSRCLNWYSKHRLKVYIGAGVVALLVLGLLLFVLMEPC